MKKTIRIALLVILTPVALFALFLTYIAINDYKPEPIEVLSESVGEEINVKDTFRVFNWNIGYAGLGDDMSFFYDGGQEVRTSQDRTVENLGSIAQVLSSKTDSIDFFLLQEVDRDSKRSYGMDQLELLKDELVGYEDHFATNYKVSFVPAPVSDPLGRVNGGLATFSKLAPNKVSRHAFEGNYDWPMGLFMLDRCFMVHRYKTSNGNELLIINTHNSAYDDGTLRTRQMEMMKEFLFEEYARGNYIVVGGDWNQEPPMADSKASDGKRGHLTSIQISPDFMPKEWSWINNDNAPTNRLIDEVYNPETTKTSVIDFFLISPNITCVYSKNIDLEFHNSDHNPVYVTLAFDE